jgi:hypothetical protein
VNIQFQTEHIHNHHLPCGCDKGHLEEVVRNTLELAASLFDVRHPADKYGIGALITYKQVSQAIRALKESGA